jgi:hypothetical protein
MINDRNETPVFVTRPISTTVPTGRIWSTTFVAHDVDFGDQLTFATSDLPPWASVITSTTSSTGEATITITGTPDEVALWDATLIVEDHDGLLGFLAVRLRGYEPHRYYFPRVVH